MNERTRETCLWLHRELADWYPLLTSVADHAEEAAFNRRIPAYVQKALPPAAPDPARSRQRPQRRAPQGDAGLDLFDPLAVPFEHSSYSNTGHDVFLGQRPACSEGTS